MVELYKVLTHDYRSPIQGGEPVFDGKLPFELPMVEVDRGQEECAAGWNACRSPEGALTIAGLWPNGRPSRLYRVVVDGEVIERGSKCRFATGTLAEEMDPTETIRKLHAPFGEHLEGIVKEVLAWREALARPGRDRELVKEGLQKALDIRGLKRTLREYSSARAVWAGWAARDAWDDARTVRDAWNAWDVLAVWDARAARDVRDALTVWDARAVWTVWAAEEARDARDALTVWDASARGWIKRDLTTGLRDAYKAGLGFAMPTGENELGWTMDL